MPVVDIGWLRTGDCLAASKQGHHRSKSSKGDDSGMMNFSCHRCRPPAVSPKAKTNQRLGRGKTTDTTLDLCVSLRFRNTKGSHSAMP
eukprot:scaffold889_cov268-Pinguiococcus_pyrenoidosus.AAC.9